MTKLIEYKQLLAKNYEKAVEYLLGKYGEPKDDYFRENSYNRFFRGEIKTITKGKFSRSVDGLECHHIDEDKYLNMTNFEFIKEQNIPFELQKKEKLVYADVIEHAILHVLIAKETALNFGYPGYVVFLEPKIAEWYVDKDIPQKSKHHISCYHKAYVKPEEAIELIRIMDGILSVESEKIEQKRIGKIKNLIEEGNFKRLNKDSPNSEIVRAMYELLKTGAHGYNYIFKAFVYSEEQDKKIYQIVDFEVFERNIKEFDQDGILENVLLYISYVEGEIDTQDYQLKSKLYSKTKKEVEEEEKRKKEEERLAKLEALKAEEFYLKYPKFKDIDLGHYAMRQEVNAMLFKYNEQYSSFLKFQSAMKEYTMDELLNNLHEILK